MKLTNVYIDESGDLGQKSKWLIFASVETESPRSLEKAIKKIWRAKPQLHAHGELHANASDDNTRIRVLKTISEQMLTIRYVAIDKSKLKGKRDLVYYQKLAAFIPYHRNAQIFMVDKKDTDKKRIDAIRQLGLQEVFSNVEFELSHRVKQLQAADFVAWAIGRAYETSDSSFIELLSQAREVPDI